MHITLIFEAIAELGNNNKIILLIKKKIKCQYKYQNMYKKILIKKNNKLIISMWATFVFNSPSPFLIPLHSLKIAIKILQTINTKH